MTEFATLPMLMTYKIDHGGQNAGIAVSLPAHPFLPPERNPVEEANIVIRTEFLYNPGLSDEDSGLPPKWIRLSLFEPRSDSIMPPPPTPASQILRGSDRDREESELFTNYVNFHYQPTPGGDLVSRSSQDLAPDRLNTTWPGARRSHQTTYVGEVFVDSGTQYLVIERIPLRVSATLSQGVKPMLLVTEIKRTLRLKINAFQVLVDFRSSQTRLEALKKLHAGELSLEKARLHYGLSFVPHRE